MLLLQDLAVVPLLIVVELLGQGADGMALALVRAATKTIVTLATMSFIGKKVSLSVSHTDPNPNCSPNQRQWNICRRHCVV